MFSRAAKIAASILAADFANFGAECRAVVAQGADWVHVDVMDGHFVPNLTFGPPMVAALRRHIDVVMDVHLMIAPVDAHIQAYADAGADIISAHVEAGPHIHRTVQAIRAAGVRPAVAINPATPLESLEYILDDVDMVNVLAVNPGFGGQKFIASQYEKIRRLRAMIGDRPVHIQVDGGVAFDTITDISAAGADVFVAGSAVFKGGSAEAAEPYGANIAKLRNLAQTSVNK